MNRQGYRVILVCFAFCTTMILGLSFVNAQDETRTPDIEPRYSIIFTSDPSFAYSDIYAMDLSGENIVPLVTDALAQYPVWSPDSGKLAFVSSRPGGEDIIVLDFEAEVAVNITQNQAYEQSPRWSPDDQQIAFTTDTTGDWEVFVVNADGSNMTNLTNYPDAAEGTWGLDWSPDGEQIVFTSNRNGRDGIYLMDTDGSDQRLLVSNDPPSVDHYPAWSPTENLVIFVSHRVDGYGLYTVNDHGDDLRYLEPALDFPPTGRYAQLSRLPDGLHIVFQICSTARIDSCELYMAESDGSHQVRLTNNERYDSYPGWISNDVLESDIFPISLPDALHVP